jgi:hypothetical protein
LAGGVPGQGVVVEGVRRQISPHAAKKYRKNLPRAGGFLHLMA